MMETQTNFDYLLKQTFDEFRTCNTLINNFCITFDDNKTTLLIEFSSIDDYTKYLKLFDNNHVEKKSQNMKFLTALNVLFTITFKFGKSFLTSYILHNLRDVTQDWIMQNLPQNVIKMNYHRMTQQIFPLDKLPRNLNLLIVSELGKASNLTQLPEGLEKLNLFNCFQVMHNLNKLPTGLKILILAPDYCEFNNRTYYYHDLKMLPKSLEYVCYGKLKMTLKQLEYFEEHDYYKYTEFSDETVNIFDKFILNIFFNKKKYFMTNYEYNENDWCHLAS